MSRACARVETSPQSPARRGQGWSFEGLVRRRPAAAARALRYDGRDYPPRGKAAMAMIQFVRNYDDLSTDMGFQFKFHCDKCGNGFMSRFQASAIGMAGSALRVAEDLFGGVFGRGASSAAYEVQRARSAARRTTTRSRAAVKEGARREFSRECSRCGRWVCPESAGIRKPTSAPSARPSSSRSSRPTTRTRRLPPRATSCTRRPRGPTTRAASR